MRFVGWWEVDEGLDGGVGGLVLLIGGRWMKDYKTGWVGSLCWLVGCE